MDIFSDTIFRDLEKLDFSINESKVYLILLKLGPNMAGRVSKEANLDRTSVYNALKSLLQRGIVSYAVEANRKVFKAENPDKILDYYKEKEEISKSITLKLKQFYNKKNEKSNLTLYQNFKGLKTVFQDILISCKKGDEYLVIGSEGQFSEKMPYYSPLFRKFKEKNKIKTRMLIRSDTIKKRGKLTEYRIIPSDIKSPATINIFDGKVAIFIWDEKPEAILIKNKDISESFKNYFNFMWKNAKS